MCIGCPKGWRCCGRAWGKCVCTLPGWDSCCTRVKNAVCIAANAACWALKKPLDVILKAAIFVVDKSKGVLDVAKVALTLAQGVLHTAKLALNAANAALEGVKVLYKVGATALTALVDFAFTKLINIREIYFRRALSVANIFEFDCRVKGVLLGANMDIRVKFNVRDVLSLIGVIADRAISGLSKFIG